jgi:hypothetical protein
LLVVDSHFWPLEWEGMGTSDAHLRLNSRCQPGNSTFTLQKTTPYSVRRADATGAILETKTFKPLPGVSQFHDSLGYYPGLRYRDANGGLYFWDAPASLAVPAKGSYTTKITWGDKTPATDLYGVDLGDTILGSGNPGDADVQYGLHLAVVNQAKDGTWGMIKVWNSATLVDLEKYAPAKAKPGSLLRYTLKVTNKTPEFQSFEVNDPIPANTSFFWLWGRYYDHANKQIHWTGHLGPYATEYLSFWVIIDRSTLPGTSITNDATLTDGAVGGTASVTTEVVNCKEHIQDEMENNGFGVFLPLITR